MSRGAGQAAVYGILQARILEWVAYPFSRGSFWPRNWAWVSCIAGGFFTNWATREAFSNGTQGYKVVITSLTTPSPPSCGTSVCPPCGLLAPSHSRLLLWRVSIPTAVVCSAGSVVGFVSPPLDWVFFNTCIEKRELSSYLLKLIFLLRAQLRSFQSTQRASFYL